MPIPDFQSLMLPTLKAFNASEEMPLSEVRKQIKDAEGLSAEDIREMLSSGRQTKFANRVNWAVIYMERAHLLARVRRGVYRLTQEGKRLLVQAPLRIDINLLEEKYPDFAEWRQRANTLPRGKDEGAKQNDNIIETPEEVLERVAQQLRSELEADVLSRVRDAESSFLS
ncbi:MAG: hypothetical protein OXN23_04810 [Gammaproteobacteria bacterium]|nr:hypothetical protein [Gammaproteobacteria bacterium]